VSRARQALDRLAGGQSPADCRQEIDAGLARASSLEDLGDLLAAGSILLHAAARAGDWQAVDLSRGLEAIEALRGPEAESVVLAVGAAGRDVLVHWCRQDGPRRLPRSLLLDCDSARVSGLPAAVPQVGIDILAAADGPVPTSHCDLLRAAYRQAAGAAGPPPAVAEILGAARAERQTIHVIVGLEDPWIAVIPDLALDLRALLGHARCRIFLHLATRPAPRLRGGFLSALADIERSRPADDAFLVSGMEAEVAERVGDLIRMADEAPEVLATAVEKHRGGAFSSYGVAAVALAADDGPSARLRALDEALTAAAPAWLPGARPLPEQVSERTYLVHDPAVAPPDEAWRLCPEILLIPVSGATLKICRIQRGLSLRDARLT
jgi:hypothetical protein